MLHRQLPNLNSHFDKSLDKSLDKTHHNLPPKALTHATEYRTIALAAE